MKKYFMSVMLMLLCSVCQALPIGNPADPALFTEGASLHACRYNEWWTFRIGFYGDYVFERHGKLAGEGSHAHLLHTRLNTNAGLLVANFWQRCDLFATLGASHLFLHADTDALVGNGVFLDTETSFSWSLGGRLIVIQHCNWFLGVEGQYFVFTPHINSIRNEATSGLIPNINYPNKTLYYHEWQAGASLAYSIGLTCCGLKPVPYIGVKWSNLRADLKGATSPAPKNLLFDRLKEQRQVGFALGVTLMGSCRLSVNVEGRFTDERAFALNSQFRF